jgi:predicted nucleic acid-binding protein
LTVYWDSSALLRLTDEVSRRLQEPARHMTLSHLTELEMRSALVRRRNLPPASLSRYRARLLRRLRRLSLLHFPQVLPSLFESALDLIDRRAVRSADALHLAAALSIRRGTSEPVELATYDGQLREAAIREGLSVYPSA